MSDYSIDVEGGFDCDGVIILSALAEHEMNSSRRLYEDLIQLSLTVGHIPPQLFRLSTPGQLLSFLERLNVVAINGLRKPMLHIDAHGHKDKGIKVGDGYVSWRLLGSYIRGINYGTKNNLGLFLSCCHGVNLFYDLVELSKPAPCWYLIAPHDDISDHDASGASLSFYSNLFANGYADNSYLDDGQGRSDLFSEVWAPRFFLEVMLKHFLLSCSGKGKRDWVEDFITCQVWRNGDRSPEYVRALRRMAKNSFVPKESVFERYASIFMVDRGRLSVSWDQVSLFINGFNSIYR